MLKDGEHRRRFVSRAISRKGTVERAAGDTIGEGAVECMGTPAGGKSYAN
jgi:hypothetical protein